MSVRNFHEVSRNHHVVLVYFFRPTPPLATHGPSLSDALSLSCLCRGVRKVQGEPLSPEQAGNNTSPELQLYPRGLVARLPRSGVTMKFCPKLAIHACSRQTWCKQASNLGRLYL